MQLLPSSHLTRTQSVASSSSTIADPVPGPGQVAVNVRACSLNHHDLWTLRGVGVTEDSFPMVLGSDVSGVTDDGREVVVHALVADPQRGGGDELLDPRRAMLAEALQGGLASKVVVPERNVIDKPTELSFEEAACLPTAWLTAYRMLFVRAAARPGQSVLVQGAGGGVATAAIVLAHAAGLRVWVTGRTPEKLEKAIAFGSGFGFFFWRALARSGRHRARHSRRRDLEALGQLGAHRGSHRRSRGDHRRVRPKPTCPGSFFITSRSTALPWDASPNWPISSRCAETGVCDRTSTPFTHSTAPWQPSHGSHPDTLLGKWL